MLVHLHILRIFSGMGKDQKPNLMPFRELLCVNSNRRRLDVGQGGQKWSFPVCLIVYTGPL